MAKQYFGVGKGGNANMPGEKKMVDVPKAGKPPLPFKVKDDMQGLDEQAAKAYKNGAKQMYNPYR